MKKILLIGCGLLTLAVARQFVHKSNGTAEEHQPEETFNQAVLKAGVAVNFTLPATLNTSIGIYNGDILLRTLVAGKTLTAGKHSIIWDGADDNGKKVQLPDVTARIQTDSIKAIPEDIGNTSVFSHGEKVHHSYQPFCAMAECGDFIYIGRGGDESRTPFYKVRKNAPNIKINVLYDQHLGISAPWLVSDGNIVLVAGGDSWTGHTSAVVAIRAGADTIITWPGAESWTTAKGNAIPAVFGKRTNPYDVENIDYGIRGLAIQKNGNKVFVSHRSTIHIHDKTKNFRLIDSVNFPGGNVGNIAADNANHLYVTEGNIIKKYNITGNGLSYAGISFTVAKPLSVSVSADNAKVTIIDSISQQVKWFTSEGVSLPPQGEDGGYQKNANVTYNKFSFNTRDYTQEYVAHMSDGNYWVGDRGNARALLFTAARVLKDEIMYMPTHYLVYVDEGNVSNVFANFMQFSLDYKKPIKAGNNSWVLTHNWLDQIKWEDISNRPKEIYNPTTLSNGHTYALIPAHTPGGRNNYRIIELQKNGTVRYTKQTCKESDLHADGNIYGMDGFHPANKTIRFYKYQIQGFDADKDPVYAGPNTYKNSPLTTGTDPFLSGGGMQRNFEIFSNGATTTFNNYTPQAGGSKKYHFGIFKDNQWLVKTMVNTHPQYIGMFPKDFAFDIGNGVHLAGTVQVTAGKFAVVGYKGEFWKGSQAGFYMLYTEAGLPVIIFGNGGNEGEEAKQGFWGNVGSIHLFKDTQGDLALICNDEARRSSMGIWRIKNTASLKTQIIPLQINNTNGVMQEQYSGSEIDRQNIVSDSVIGAVNYSGPAKTMVYKGYFKPQFTGTYTFFTQVSGGVRLWIDTLEKPIIEQWNNAGKKDFSATFKVVADSVYQFRMELLNTTVANLEWSAEGLTKALIPTKSLYPLPSSKADNVNLLAGFTEIMQPARNEYGWTITPAQTNKPGEQWQVITGQRSYHPNTLDVTAYKSSSTISELQRTIKIPTKPNWTLEGTLLLDGNNRGNNTWVDIADNTGKVITRFITKIGTPANPDNMYERTLFINNTAVYSTSKNNPNGLILIGQAELPFTVTSQGGNLNIDLAGFILNRANTFETGANKNKPAKIIVHFGDGNGGQEDRIVGFSSLWFKSW